MKNTFNSQNSYFIIPILGIIIVIFTAIFSFPNEFKTNSMLLNDFDFTGMTSKFLILITMINLIVLFLDLYLVSKKEKNGFPYIFNKIFTLIFLLLALISVISFIIIRNKEEQIAKDFAFQVNKITNSTWQLNTIHSNTNQLKTVYDRFSGVKMTIASEASSSSKLERYLNIFIYTSILGYHNDSSPSPTEEESYYSIFSGFTLVDLLLAGLFAFHIKDEELNLKSNF